MYLTVVFRPKINNGFIIWLVDCVCLEHDELTEDDVLVKIDPVCAVSCEKRAEELCEAIDALESEISGNSRNPTWYRYTVMTSVKHGVFYVIRDKENGIFDLERVYEDESEAEDEASKDHTVEVRKINARSMDDIKFMDIEGDLLYQVNDDVTSADESDIEEESSEEESSEEERDKPYDYQRENDQNEKKCAKEIRKIVQKCIEEGVMLS